MSTNWSAKIVKPDAQRAINYRFDTVDTLSSAATLTVCFTTTDASWIGQFHGVTRLPEAVHGVFSFPVGDRALVVASGLAYVVDPADPDAWNVLDEMPIVSIIDCHAPETVIVADLLHLAAYGAEGRMWETRRLSYDGVRITHVDAKGVHGLAWSAPEDGEVPFVVDIRTGQVTGGAAPRH